MPLPWRSGRTASGAAVRGRGGRVRPHRATPTRPPRRSPARPGCRRRRSTSTSPTRRSASSRCSTPRWSAVLQAMRDAVRGTRRPTRRRACARRIAGVPRARSPTSPTRRRRCWWRSSAPARERWSGATARSTRWRRTSTSSTAATPSAAARRASPSPHDAFAIVGAVVELASRQIRTGEPGDIRELEPVVERLILGLLQPPARTRRERNSRRSRGEIVECRRCPRLVEWREQVAREKRAAFRDEEYWGRPMPGFGDPAARVLLLGLAPAAHGAQPDRADVHRRPLGRLPVRRAAPHRASPTSRRRSRATTGSS